jgi:opacity protein-like surface antigen
MERKCVQLAVFVIAMAAACGATAVAQTASSPSTTAQGATRPEPAAGSDMAGTDLGLSFYRTFTGSTRGNGTLQTPSNAYGAMAEFRHIQSPLIGYELTYGFNRANQSFAPNPGACGFNCGRTPVTHTVDASLVGLDWIASMKKGNLSPFAVGGMGFFIAAPTENLPQMNTVVRIMYTFGGGVDVGLLPHAGLRLQYRDNLYKAPDVDINFGSTDKFTHTGEAELGVYFHL